MMTEPLSLKRSAGFSLIEIMVALVVGMIGVLVIMQVARTGEAQKRVTAGAGETQTAAVLGLHTLQNDIKQAGYGFNAINVIACTLKKSNSNLTLTPFVPLRINPAGILPSGNDAHDANTDTLLVVYGSGNSAPEGDTINDTISNPLIGVMSPGHYTKGDQVFAAPSIPTDGCELILDALVSVGNGTVQTGNTLGAEIGGSLFNLGKAPKIMAYAIRGGALASCDYMSADCSDKNNWTRIAEGIVSLRAQYGHSGDWSNTLDIAATDQEGIACAWSRVNALRLAIVSRNGEWSREEITTQAPTWSGSGEADGSAPINLSRLPNWKHYRYQVYEATIPLRNVPWMGVGPC